MRTIKIISVVAGLLALAGCGDTTEERAASGGIVGGAAGLVVGAPLVGAGVGAGVGAVSD